MKTRNRKITKNNFFTVVWIVAAILITWGCEPATRESEIQEEPGTVLKADHMDWEGSEVVQVADVMPEPEEGLDAFLRYIGNHIKYPAEAREKGIEGKVFISFIITTEGLMANVKVEKGIGYGLDEEAVRVVSSYNKKWKPGINQGEKVNTQMVLPINYAL